MGNFFYCTVFFRLPVSFKLNLKKSRAEKSPRGARVKTVKHIPDVPSAIQLWAVPASLDKMFRSFWPFKSYQRHLYLELMITATDIQLGEEMPANHVMLGIQRFIP